MTMEMKSTLEMAVPSLLAATAMIVLAFALAEGRGDERSALHRYLASRAAFLLGLIALAVGTIWETFHHILDPWLIGALAAMTFGKIAGLLYARLKK